MSFVRESLSADDTGRAEQVTPSRETTGEPDEELARRLSSASRDYQRRLSEPELERGARAPRSSASLTLSVRPPNSRLFSCEIASVASPAELISTKAKP